MVKRFMSIAGVAGLAMIVLTACGGDTNEAANEDVTRIPAEGAPNYATPLPGEEGSPTGEPAVAQGSPPSAAEAAVTVISRDVLFEPTEFQVPAGQDVTVALPNEGALPHNFSIDALSIDVDLAAGTTDGSATVNVAAGDYEYYCNVPGHKEAGMRGVLTAQ